ncbi:DUF4806 domain-containing protein, partial [Aphis craccivora]
MVMGRWEVVFFHKDNSIEAVPDTWVKKGLCAWPKSSKNIKQYKPNKTDFLYYPARILGTKNYATLAEAQSKLSKAATHSDLSTTEDQVNKKKKKTFNSSRLNDVNERHEPPLYKDFYSKVTKSNQDVESAFPVINNHSSLSDNDDSDNDPTWGNKVASNNGSCSDDSTSEANNIMIPSTPNAVFSPNTQVWKVNELNEHEKTEMTLNFQTVFKSPDKWHISSTYNQTKDPEALKQVTKTLVLDDNTKNVNGDGVVTSKSADNLHSSINHDGGVFMSSHDFQKFTFTTLTHLKYDMSAMMHIIKDTNEKVQALIFKNFPFTTLTHLKYDISAMMHIIKDTNEKVQALVSKTNNNLISTISPTQNSINMNMFPLTNNDELSAVEIKIDDPHYRNELICELSLLVDNNSLNTSVRRIISRLCDDALLVSYSLTGFKHNKPFGSLKIYRVIIGKYPLPT